MTSAITIVTRVSPARHTRTAPTRPSAARSPRRCIGVFIFYGFIYTPIISYVSARMEGIVGMSVQIPFVREATFILTGYQGAAIWFAPFPVAQLRRADALFPQDRAHRHEDQLDGQGRAVRLSDRADRDDRVQPVHLEDRAGARARAFPYAEKLWELNAYRQGLMYSSTTARRRAWAVRAGVRARVLSHRPGAGARGRTRSCRCFGLPVLLVYGVIRGLDQSTPDVILPQFIGALLGRYYFAKKFGTNWPQYRVVFFAGYALRRGA